jgi:hypothetical protein
VSISSVLLDISGYNPAPGSIPGAGTFMTITNWAAFMGEIGCLFGLVISVLLAVVGRAAGNSLAAGVGTILSIPCLLGAVLIANAGNLINIFIHLGLK